MSAHNICFRGEVRKIFICLLLLSTAMILASTVPARNLKYSVVYRLAGIKLLFFLSTSSCQSNIQCAVCINYIPASFAVCLDSNILALLGDQRKMCPMYTNTFAYSIADTFFPCNSQT